MSSLWWVGIVLFFAAFYVRNRLRSRKAHALVEKAGALLLDVRTAAEFQSGHLKGAVNVPLDKLGKRPRDLPGKERPLVVYCRSGARSAAAVQQLKALGYETVVNLGPMSAW